MSSESSVRSSTSKLETCDPVWAHVRAEAEAIAESEPELAAFIYANILGHECLEDAVIHRLAQRLGHGDVGPELMRQAFEDALEEEPAIGEAIRADIAAVLDRDPACDRHLEPVLYFKGFHAISSYRFANRLWKMGRQDFALYVQSRISEVCGVDVHPEARIGRGIMVDHATGVVIGRTAVIEDEVSILHGVTLGGTGKESGDRHPKVRHGVLIGAGAKILGNIEIGHCSRIASGSVVLKDVPPNRTVAGVPARIVGFAGCEEPALSMDQMLNNEDE